MKKTLSKRLIALLLALLMLPVWVPTTAEAVEVPLPGAADSGTLIGNVNPRYQGIYTADDFPVTALPEIPKADAQPQATYQTMTQAAVQMRSYLKNRTESFTIYLTTDSSNFSSIMETMVANAMVHTGNPKEGDYLQWQWGRWDASYVRSWTGSVYNYTINITFVYYTTAAQEAELNTAISRLISSLGLSGKSDYAKISAVYDYICDNVTYDYTNLNDESYTLKFTAYAALMDKTAVCQGYAVLFYRLMLELGIDSRVITGIGGGGAHGWNIVELGGLYYNVDSTWDAGMTEYSYFLTNTWNFLDHYRYLDYETWEFHEAYPMAAENYDPDVTAEIDPYIYIDYCGDNAAFAVERDGTLTIAGTGSTYDYNGTDWSGSGAPWQFWGEHIEKLVVEDGVTRLGDQSFRDMDTIKSIELPGSLTTVGYMAFYLCDGLTSVTLPEGLTEIEGYAFGDAGITKVTLPDTLVTIGAEAFRYCENLTAVTIPESVTSLGTYAFSGCDSLKSVVIPESITSFGMYCFGYCEGLLKAEIYSATVPQYIFEGCNNLSEVILHDTVQVLSDSALGGMEALEEIIIPASVVEIGAYSFGSYNEDSSLKTIYFLGDAPALDEAALTGCTMTAYYPEGNETWTADVGANYGGTITWKAKQFATITQQPEDAMAMEGETASVTVEAEGEGLTYEWYFANAGSDKFLLTTTFTGPTYSVEMNEARDGRRVYCVVTDKYGASVKSDTVTLSLITQATIIKEPEDAQAQLGQEAKTKVEAGGKGLTYTWYVKDVGGSFVKSSVKTATYSFPMTEAKIGRQAYCVITDEEGNSVTTRTVTFNLAVTLLEQPQDVAVLEGETAAVTIQALGDGLSYAWYYSEPGTTRFYLTNSFKGATYSVAMTEARNGRRIYCVVTDQYGNSVQTDTVTLTMMAKLEITRQPESITVAEGKNAKISFTAAGDGLTYKWYYKNAGDSEFSYTATFTGNTYSATMNDARNGRQVYCVVTDKYGNSVQTDTVTMTMAAKPVITRQPESAFVPEGATVTIDFAVTGEGLTYKWYFKNAGASKFTYTPTFSGNTYTAVMNADRNGRQVYCVVTDKYGNTVKTDTVTMTMVTALAITSQPESVTVAEGKTAKISFTAAGDGLTYKWYYKNAGDSEFSYTATFIGNTYSATMNDARNGRQVYCVVTDKYGNSVQTDTVTMTMAAKPVITRQPESASALEGETVTVDFAVTGEGLTYKWYFRNAGASKFTYTPTFSGNTYTAVMNADRNGRQVYCVVTDKYGNSVQTDTVTISMAAATALEITRQPESVTVAEGGTVTIDFAVTGDGLTYKWYFKNAGASKFTYTATFSGNTYTTEMNDARNGRQVYCIVTDKYGNSVQTNTVTMTMAEETLTEAAVYQSMIALKSEYPEGMIWTNDNSYAWNGGIFYSGSGCAGFAFILSDAAFGTLPARQVFENITVDTVRVGDILRVNGDTHSVIILEVHETYVVIAEGNYNSSIHWGRTMTAEEVAASDYCLTRYPEA